MKVAAEGRLTIDNDQLPETELDVPRPWRHVDDEDVQVTGLVAPVHVE